MEREKSGRDRISHGEFEMNMNGILGEKDSSLKQGLGIFLISEFVMKKESKKTNKKRAKKKKKGKSKSLYLAFTHPQVESKLPYP